MFATRVAFLYYHSIDPKDDFPRRDNQILVRYQFDEDQYELSSVVDSTTVSGSEAAQNWLEEQYLTIETLLDTHQVLIDPAQDIHGLGLTRVRNLVKIFETLDAIRQVGIKTLVGIPYVSDEIAPVLQVALEGVKAVVDNDSLPLEQELRTSDEPLIVDMERGAILGELVPSGDSGPAFSPDELGEIRLDDR